MSQVQEIAFSPASAAARGKIEEAPPASAETHLLVPLTSIRFFAALHIFLYHLYGAHKTDPAGIGLPILDRIPAWLGWLFQHGYASTSLFFLLSGFILAYVYVGADGKPTVPYRDFLIARLTRVYPLHIVALLLITPAAITIGMDAPHHTFFGQPISPVLFTGIGGFLCLTLTQAWFPEYALSWNFPTWALSVVLFFYIVFLPLARWIAGLTRRTQWLLLLLCPVISLLPSLLYIRTHRVEEPNSFGMEFLMRSPLLWLPHFLMGLLLARVHTITRYDAGWRDRSKPTHFSAGDLSALILLCIFVADDAVLSRWLGLFSHTPLLYLRHGLLAPLFLILVYDLARERGFTARILSVPLLQRLGDTSFSLFILQLPVRILSAPLVPPTLHSGLRLLLLILAAVFCSLLSVNYFEKPVARALRQRLLQKKRAGPSPTI